MLLGRAARMVAKARFGTQLRDLGVERVATDAKAAQGRAPTADGTCASIAHCPIRASRSQVDRDPRRPTPRA
jgi:hypothetical protein